MTTNTFVDVFCPRCGFSFKAEATNVARNVGGLSGVAAGAALGAKVGIVGGPLGAIAGTVPGAILGAVFGAKAGNRLDRPQCPKCGQSFDMVKPVSTVPAESALPSLFEELGSLSDLIVNLRSSKDELDFVVEGMIAIPSVVRKANDKLGLTVQPGSALADFEKSSKERDFDQVSVILHAMIHGLDRVNTRYDRGVLMCFFFTGEEPT